jgi:Ca-activated chloride channel family protein
MTFDAPVVLFLAPVVGGAVWLAAVWARRVRIQRALRWSNETAARARDAGRLGASTLGMAALLGTVALAGPRWGAETIIAERRGLSLVLAIDISRSMLAEDVQPSRLARTLREARRLVQDLDGDRLGLIGFAGASYVLSPLSIDGSALLLYLDALEPDIASEGGTALGPALAQGSELLRAGTETADRVLVVFTDGEAHDSLPDILTKARELQAAGVRLILVAEGRTEPVRIPRRDEHGALLSYQEDENGEVVRTARHDEVLTAIADAAGGAIVAADLPDQAGAVRDLVSSYKRAAESATRTNQGRPRAWVPLAGAILLLVVQSLSRRTAALVCLVGLAGTSAADAQAPRSAPTPRRPRPATQRAWDAGRPADAARAALGPINRAHGDVDPATWYNAGTAALAAGDPATARTALSRAAASLDPDLRFRSLFNLGVAALVQARSDSAGRERLLGEAERAYREALLLRPSDAPAKWNLELATRQRQQSSGGGGGGGGGGQPPSAGGSGKDSTSAGQQPTAGQLSQGQAEQILQSIGQEELRTRRDRTGGTRQATPPRVKDW